MKNKVKKTSVKVMVALGLLLGGGIIGFAASSALPNLDAIQANFDAVFNQVKTQKSANAELTNKLANNKQEQEQLNNQINDLKNQLKDKDNTISGKQQEIAGKQQELANKQQELDRKQQEADALRQQVDATKGEKEQLEQRIAQLKQYTDQKVNELGN